MTHLRQMMLEEIERRDYAKATIRHYLRFVEDLAQHFHKSPDKLGLEHLRCYQAYLLKQRKLSPGSVEHANCSNNAPLHTVLLVPAHQKRRSRLLQGTAPCSRNRAANA